MTKEFITYVCNQVLMKHGGYKTVLNSIRTDQANVTHDSVADLIPLREKIQMMDQSQRQTLAKKLYSEGRNFLDFLSINGVSGYYFSSSITKLTSQNDFVFDGLSRTAKGHCVVAENPQSIRSLEKLCFIVDPQFEPFIVQTQPKKLVHERILIATGEDVAEFLATEPLYEGNGKHFLQAFDVYLRLLNKKNISGISSNYTLALLAKILVAKVNDYPIGVEGKLTEGNRSLSRLELQALYALDWTVIQCEQMLNVTEASSFDICKALRFLPTDVNYSNYEAYYKQIIDSVEKSALQDNIEKDLVEPSEQTIKEITDNINSNGGDITEDEVADIVSDKGYMSSVLSSIKKNAGKLAVGAVGLATVGAIVYMKYAADNDSDQDNNGVSGTAPPGAMFPENVGAMEVYSPKESETSALAATIDTIAKLATDFVPSTQTLADLGSKVYSYVPNFGITNAFSSAFVGKIIPIVSTDMGETVTATMSGANPINMIPEPSEQYTGTAVPFLNSGANKIIYGAN